MAWNVYFKFWHVICFYGKWRFSHQIVLGWTSLKHFCCFGSVNRMGDFLDGCADCKQDHPTPTTFVFMMSWHMAVCPSLSPTTFSHHWISSYHGRRFLKVLGQHQQPLIKVWLFVLYRRYIRTSQSSIDDYSSVGNLHMNSDQVLFFGAHIWDCVASLAEHEHGPSVECRVDGI